MKHIKAYKLFESVRDSIGDILLDLQDQGYTVDISNGDIVFDKYGNKYSTTEGDDFFIITLNSFKTITNKSGNMRFKRDPFYYIDIKNELDHLMSFMSEGGYDLVSIIVGDKDDDFILYEDDIINDVLKDNDKIDEICLRFYLKKYSGESKLKK